MKSEIFLDTAYAVALSSPNDVFHQRAVELAVQLEAANAKLVTTHAVLLEIGNALSKRRYRPSAIRLLEAISNDPRVRIVPITEELYNRAVQLFGNRPDKEWGLTDCVSLVVMQELEITTALTSDDHFQQAGFIALLREAT